MRIQMISLCFLSLVFISCSHTLKIVDANDGMTIMGKLEEKGNKVSVTMPDGELLQGNLTKYYPAATTFGNATGFNMPPINTRYAGSNTVSTTAIVTSSSGEAYAILTGTKGTVMEILMKYTGNQGFGDALTNKGKKYKVQMLP